MKKSKHSRKILPPNQEGLYELFDPNRYIENNLCDWYESVIIGFIGYIPSEILHKDIFTLEDCEKFTNMLRQDIPDLYKNAYNGWDQLQPFPPFKQINNEDYLDKISYKVATYKSLLNVKKAMASCLNKKSYKEQYGEIAVTPGRAREDLIHFFIQDLMSVTKKYCNDTGRIKSLIAFYLAKQDIFNNLSRCRHKDKAQPCSTIDCTDIKQNECVQSIKYYSQEYFNSMKEENVDPDFSPSEIILCKETFEYLNCKKCRKYLDYLSDTIDFNKKDITNILRFLRTPCKPSTKRFDDIFERINHDKKRRESKEMNVIDKMKFKKQVEIARRNNKRKDLSNIFNEVQTQYPHFSRKKIQRIFSK